MNQINSSVTANINRNKTSNLRPISIAVGTYLIRYSLLSVKGCLSFVKRNIGEKKSLKR